MPKSVLGIAMFYIRRLLDFQMLTIYLDLRQQVKKMRGVVLDVGCGEGPYVHLLPKDVDYTGIDILDAGTFGLSAERKFMPFDGTHIPFADNSVNHIICSEVLEHVLVPEPLIAEMLRVLKPGGDVFVTVPWSARYHYIPYDYTRYTPSKLAQLFAGFAECKVTARGSDIAAVCNKLMVMGARQVYARKKIRPLGLALMLLVAPFWALVVLWGLVAIWFKLGSTNDPLGYTVRLRKA